MFHPFDRFMKSVIFPFRILQGPHQSATKSTSIGRWDLRTIYSKCCWFVISMIDIIDFLKTIKLSK